MEVRTTHACTVLYIIINHGKCRQLDNNPIGDSWAGIPSLIKLSLRNCSMIGTVPDLTGLRNLIFIAFSNSELEGNVPTSYAALNAIHNLDVCNNKWSGSIPAFGSGTSLTQIAVLDFQNNNFTGWDAATSDLASRPNKTVWLTGNTRLCDGGDTIVPERTQLLVCQGAQSVLQVLGAQRHWTKPIRAARRTE